MFPNEEVPFFLNAQEGGNAVERRSAWEKRCLGGGGACVARERWGVPGGKEGDGRRGAAGEGERWGRREGGKEEAAREEGVGRTDEGEGEALRIF